MNGYYGGDTVYQTEFEIKFGGTTKKFYVIRGDIMPDGRKLSEYLKIILLSMANIRSQTK